MVNIKIPIHKRNLATRIEGIHKWKISDEDKKNLIKFLDELGLGKVNKGKRISETRQVKYLDILKIPLEYFNQPSSKLKLKDVEDFEKALNTDKLKSYKGTPFADATKVDIRRALKIYLTWKLGERARKMTDWFDLGLKRKTPDYLSEQEATKLYKNCKNASERFLIAVLFDSGARAEEFHNIRFEDIQIPAGADSFVKLTLKEEYSKTKGRVISLYWKYSLEAVREYLEERKKESPTSNEPIFKNSYDNTRQMLDRLGKKVLNKSLHYHLFRHSSATYYAPKLNRQELCYRFGWAFSSDMPDVYISRAGMENKELDVKFNSTELEDLKIQLEKEKTSKTIELEEQKKKINTFESELGKQRKDNEEIKKMLEAKEKEADWDTMVFHRMVEHPELAPKMINAFRKVWDKIDKEQGTNWRKSLKENRNEKQAKRT